MEDDEEEKADEIEGENAETEGWADKEDETVEEEESNEEDGESVLCCSRKEAISCRVDCSSGVNAQREKSCAALRISSISSVESAEDDDERGKRDGESSFAESSCSLSAE